MSLNGDYAMVTNPAKGSDSRENLVQQGFLNTLSNGLGKWVGPTSRAFGLVGGIIVVSMMSLVFVSVFARYIFRRPIAGDMEIIELMMAATVILSIVYTSYCKAHIRVDLVLGYLNRRANLVLDILAYTVAAVIFALISWQSYMNIWTVIGDNKTTLITHIPIFLFAILLSIGMLFIVLIFIKNTVDSIIDLRRHQ
jgi:TRAP-type C4-dicarboxylate transport system permease small subunit